MARARTGGEYHSDPFTSPRSGSSRDSPGAVTWPHACQFYETDDFLFDSVAEFLSDGLLAGEPVVVLATRDHRDALTERVTSRGTSWEKAREAGRLVWMDAEQALELVMMGRVPDEQHFDDHIGSLIRRSSGGDASIRVRAYGEMVDLLWREGQDEAALRVEDLWNDLARSEGLSLLCAYYRANMYMEKRGRPYAAVAERHATVLPPESGTALG